MEDQMQLSSPGRGNSIGTLTGWQLLAQSVRPSDADTLSSAPGSFSHDQRTTIKQAAARVKHRRSPSDMSRTSSMSDDSGVGPAAAAVTPRPHQWLYKEYKIQDEIGSGGFGRVCRARRLTDGKVVVVKEIKTTSLSAKQKAATMDEVQVLANFNHPNIVKYHDCFMDDVYINIVMEYCNDGDLSRLIKHRAGQLMPEHDIMSLFVQICVALQYVHSAGVLHRDLKTSNVLMTSNTNFGSMPLLKLGDFGVAKISDADSSMASTIVGTPQYLSPEMCDNKPYGKKSDIWALGCILYELCSLKKAFDVGTGGISSVFLKIMRGVYAPIPASYSNEMRELVSSMLTTDPMHRPHAVEILNMSYVKQHLGSYLDWARHVPEAHPEILLASLGVSYKGSRGSKAGQSHAANLARLSPMRGWSSTGSGSGGSSHPLLQQVSGSSGSPRAGQRGSSTAVSSEHAAAAAAVAGLSVRSKHGSGSTISHGSLSATGSGSSTGADVAAAGSGLAAAAAAAPSGSQDLELFPPAQVVHQMFCTVSPASPADLPPRGPVAGWVSSIPHKQSSSGSSNRDQHMSSSHGSSGHLSPAQLLQHAAGGSAGSTNSAFSTFASQPGTSSSWAVQGPDVLRHSSANSNQPGLVQEQVEGLRRLRGLKSRLQVHNCWDSVGSAHRIGSSSWRGLPLDDDVAHMSHVSSML